MHRNFSVPVGLDKAYLNLVSLRRQVQLSGLHTDKELDPINWESIIENDGFIDDSCKDEISHNSQEEDESCLAKFYHAQLRDKYIKIEQRDGIKPCDVFAQHSISGLQDQEFLLILWDSSHDLHHRGLRRGEELFHFIDQEELGQDGFEKFVGFHLEASGANHYGEVTFEAFVQVYQLIEAQYRSPQSILGRLFQTPVDSSDGEGESEDETTQDMNWNQYRVELLRRVSYVTIKEQQLLFEQDQDLTHIYFVFQGSIQIFRKTKDGEVQIIGNVGNGGNYGIMEFVSGQKLLLNGVATTKTYAIKLPVDGFAKLLSRDWRFTWMILTAILGDVRGMQLLLQSEALSFRNPPLQKATLMRSASSNPPTPKKTESTKRKMSEPLINEVLEQTFDQDTDLAHKILELIRNDTTGDFKIVNLKIGEYVYHQSDSSESLFILITGIAGRILKLEFEKEVRLYPGEIIGETGFFCRMDRTADVRCLTRCSLLQISKAGVLQLAKQNSRYLDCFVKQTIHGIFEHIRSLKYGYKYFTLRNGEHLIRPGDSADSFFFLINGRLRQQERSEEGEMKKLDEWFKSGSSIGLRELLLEHQHTSYTTAIRDSELVQFDKVWVTQLMSSNPQGFQNLIRTALEKKVPSVIQSQKKKIIGVVPLSQAVPVFGFVCNLIKVLKRHGSVKVVTEVLLRQRFGLLNHFATSTTTQNVWNFLSALHEKYEFVLCIAKPNVSHWTRWMLQHVDMTLLIGHSNCPQPSLTEWEMGLNFYDSPYYLTEKRLVILHPKNSIIKGSKANFLKARKEGSGKIAFHHHLFEGDRLQYESLARFISGNAVGLVLGGGGARGLAHVGVVKALRQAGIPIDLVGGVSMGSQVGALVAANLTLDEVSHRLWRAYMGNKLVDLTFPYMSLLSGRSFCYRLSKYLGMNDKQIEDLTLPYFCLSCNLSHLKEFIHDEGTMWQAMRASSSLPLIFPPVVKAPKGDLLVDGGYINNLPVDVMREQYGANIVIAVDVGDYSKLFLHDFVDYISGWKILINNFLGRTNFPTVYELLLQLGGVVDFNKQDTRFKYVDVRIAPHLKGVSSWQDFHLHDSLIKKGYDSARGILDQIKKEKPILWSLIYGKVDYPPELLQGPKPNESRALRITEYIASILFNPKLIVILILGFGLYRFVFLCIKFFQFLREKQSQSYTLAASALQSLFGEFGRGVF